MQLVPTNTIIFSQPDYRNFAEQFKGAKNNKELYKLIVNTPFVYKLAVTKLSLGIMVLLLVNKKQDTIDRIALSDNELAEATKAISAKPFEDIKIPLDNKENIISRVIKTGKPHSTVDWRFLFIPELTAQEARFNQAAGGIGFSAVFPLKARDGGALIYSYYQYQEDIGKEQYDFMKKYTKVVNSSLK